jgi:hypothetical protein
MRITMTVHVPGSVHCHCRSAPECFTDSEVRGVPAMSISSQ